MKYAWFIFIGFATAFLAYLFFAENRDIGERDFETKTDEQGQVTVKVTLQNMNNAQWKFDIVFDTHSVELDQDLVQITELTDNQGNVYKPIIWEGSPPGGHHREGVLVFEPVSPRPPSIELKIKNVGGIAERSFEWYLQ